jgi:hypothetical protein
MCRCGGRSLSIKKWSCCVRTIRFLINTTKNYQKGKIEINFVLPLCLGNTARYLQLLHPSADELGVLVNTPIFTWAYTRTFKERGKKGSLTRLTPVVFPMKWDAVYLHKKRKIGYEKKFTE